MELPKELEYSWENAEALRAEARESGKSARRLYEAKLEAWRQGVIIGEDVGDGVIPPEAEERMGEVKKVEGVGDSPLGLAFARRVYWRRWASEAHATLGLLDYDRQDPELEEWERKASWEGTVRDLERLTEEARAWEGRLEEELFDVAAPRFFIMYAMEEFARGGEGGDTRKAEATIALHLMHLYHAEGIAGGKLSLALQYEAFSAGMLEGVTVAREKAKKAQEIERAITAEAKKEGRTRGKNIPRDVKKNVLDWLDKEYPGGVKGEGWKAAFDAFTRSKDYTPRIQQYADNWKPFKRIAEAARKDMKRKKAKSRGQKK